MEIKLTRKGTEKLLAILRRDREEIARSIILWGSDSVIGKSYAEELTTLKNVISKLEKLLPKTTK